MVGFPCRPCAWPGIAGSAAGRVPVIPGQDRRCATLWWPRGSVPAPRSRAIGSAGERLVHTEEVTGSIPVSPTRSEAYCSLEAIVGEPRGVRLSIMATANARRRGHGEDAIYFDAAKNRYIGAVSLGYGADGRRVRRKVSGKKSRK